MLISKFLLKTNYFIVDGVQLGREPGTNDCELNASDIAPAGLILNSSSNLDTKRYALLMIPNTDETVVPCFHGLLVVVWMLPLQDESFGKWNRSSCCWTLPIIVLVEMVYRLPACHPHYMVIGFRRDSPSPVLGERLCGYGFSSKWLVVSRIKVWKSLRDILPNKSLWCIISDLINQVGILTLIL